MKKWHSLGSSEKKIKKSAKLVAPWVGVLSVVGVCGVMMEAGSVSADTTVSANASVTVASSCTLMGGSSGTDTSGSSTYTANVTPGTTGTISGSKLVTLCNDTGGYSIYAIGYSGDSYTTPNNTKLLGSGNNISTSTTTGGSDSSWAMKLEQVGATTPPTFLNGFGSYHVIPETYTQIASYTAITGSASAVGASVQTKYQVYISSAQPAGTYTGKVKYTMVHPNDAAAPSAATT